MAEKRKHPQLALTTDDNKAKKPKIKSSREVELENQLEETETDLAEVEAERDELRKKLAELADKGEQHEKKVKEFPKFENGGPTVYSTWDTVVPDSACGVCCKPKSEWKEVKELNPWFSLGEYNAGQYSLWNPYFNDRRIFRLFCYDCWCQYHDIIMCCGAWTETNGHTTYVVTNWHHDQEFKVWRQTAQKWDEKASFWGHRWNQKEIDRPDPRNHTYPNEGQVTEKSAADLEKEKEYCQYVYLDHKTGELMLFVKLDMYSTRAIPISELEKTNPHLPRLRFRFPNRISFDTLLRALPKRSYDEHMQLGYFAQLSKWYDSSIA